LLFLVEFILIHKFESADLWWIKLSNSASGDRLEGQREGVEICIAAQFQCKEQGQMCLLY
jgi:hypothetical protein